jgi:hypothetical protein
VSPDNRGGLIEVTATAHRSQNLSEDTLALIVAGGDGNFPRW